MSVWRGAWLAEPIKRSPDFYVIHRITGYLADDEVRTSISGQRELIDAVFARDPDNAELARMNVLSGLGKPSPICSDRSAAPRRGHLARRRSEGF